jgi:hypothetical protein
MEFPREEIKRKSKRGVSNEENLAGESEYQTRDGILKDK